MIDPQYYQYLDYALILQDYFVDKDSGLPLSGGQISFYVDNGGLTLKTVYYQTGTSPPYAYIPLPNPITLSSVGTITDGSGNDVIPYFFPYDESELPNLIDQGYRVECISAEDIPQWTRYNFGVSAEGTTPSPVEENDFQNLLINNGFWRGTTVGNVIDISSQPNTLIAPGLHDGFDISTLTGLSDIRFLKDNNSISHTTDNVSLISLQGTNFTDDITPEYAFQYVCTAFPTGIQPPEVHKWLSFPLTLHINNLSSQTVTITFWARSVSGSNTITPHVLQFLGTGSSNPVSDFIDFPQSPITITNQWEKYTVPAFQLPSGDNPNIGGAGDDALFVTFGMPINASTSIQFAKPCLYLGSQAANNSFTSYELVNALTSGNRTGDSRASFNFWSQSNFSSFPTLGWVPMNDGTIGDIGSYVGASNYASKQTWQLYQMIWNAFYASAPLQAWAPMFTSSNAPVAYGASAYSDFSNGNSISLTKQLGRALACVGIPSNGGSTTELLGQYNGNQTHTLSQANLPNVAPTFTGNLVLTYPPLAGGGGTLPASGDSVTSNGTYTPSGTISSINPGAQTPFDLNQPTNYFNFYMKL